MNYEVYLTPTSQKSIKKLARKYPSIKNDLLHTIQALEVDPTTGASIPGWNNKVWKIRTASTDAKKGKSGGFRTIYFWQEGCKKVYLLFTYAKSAKVDVNSKEIAKFIEGLLDE